MDDRDLFSNSGFNNNDDDNSQELFSYANNNNSESEFESFNLSDFSSQAESDRKRFIKEQKRAKITRKQKLIKAFLTVFLVGVISVSIVVGSFILYAFTMVDSTMPQDLNNLELNLTTTVYVKDSKGNYVEYRRVHGQYNRIWRSYDRVAIENKDKNYEGIPQQLADAFVAIEDKRFFEHDGVDWKRTISAFANLFFHFYSSNQGGSTITQQLVKNLTGDSSQKPSRKVREIMRARYLESNYSKDIILECYLNTIAMGHGTYGVEVASNYYFGKNVNDLNLTECAALAAIAKSPVYYAPDTYPKNNEDRRNTVLYQMYEQGYITKSEYEEAKSQKLKITANSKVLNQNEINSYFIDALIEQVSSDLADKYGYDKSYADSLFYNGGYKIYATLDPKIQEVAEKAYVEAGKTAVPSAKGDPLMGAITVMDYEGHVKAIVGNLGEKTSNRAFNAATDAVRQPGSSIKPLAVYAPAIEDDVITYSTIMNDTKTMYKNWYPKNANGNFSGNVTIQNALERSLNTIPVSLVNKIKPEVLYKFATEKIGLKNLTNADKDLAPLGMGGTNGGVTTMQSAAAYAIFGNGGYYYEPTLYEKVTDQQGKTILKENSKAIAAISEDTATVMNKLLQTVIYGGSGTGRSAQAYVPHMRVFGKTGTTNASSDKWFVGGSPYYVASSWCGYKTLQNMPSANTSLAMKLWGSVMSQVHSSLKAKEFPVSEYAVKRYYCTSSGKLATSACPSKAVGWYKRSNVPGTCTTHAGTALQTPTEDILPDLKKEEETTSTTSSTTSSTQSKPQ